MKKMKGVVSQYPVFEDSKTRLKHQTLLQDYHDLEMETGTVKRKLQMMKQKKMTLIAEVRFLRKRYEYLMKNQSSNDHLSNGNPVQQKQINNQVSNNNKKGKNGAGRRSALQLLPTISDINQKERIDRGIDVPLKNSTPIPVLDLNQSSNYHYSNGNPVQQKQINNQVANNNKKGKNGARRRPALQLLPMISDMNQKERIDRGSDVPLKNYTPIPVLDLNQKAKCSRKKANPSQQNSTPVFDLNQKERMYSGRDASERNITPFFDLNQISMEEEELQTPYEPLRVDELKKSLLRGGNDEQQNDIKISACRTVGDGPSRAGKRKISWQDQVALRV